MTRRCLLLSSVIILFSVFISNGQVSSSKSQKLDSSPVDSVKLRFQPYVEQQQEEMPVQVLKFVVNVGDRAMWVREWRIKNRADKKVVKIRRALFVYSESDPTTLLLRHQLGPDTLVGMSTNATWPRQQCEGNWCPNSFAMLSSTDLLAPLAQDGKIEGSYIIALGIDRVEFADSTVWELPAAKKN